MTAQELWKKLRQGQTYVIAEGGVNHLGDLTIARSMIEEAKKSGADCIKFQTYKAAKLCIRDAPRFWNPKDFDGFEEEKEDGSQFDSYSILDSFGEREHIVLKEMCLENKIEFMSTGFDNDAVNYLDKISDVGFKVASCDLTNHPFLEHVAKKGKIVFLSTGAASISEIEEAIDIISQYTEKIVVMHCNLCYPTANIDANLGMIVDLKNHFGKKYVIGLSDHTTDRQTLAYAYLLGATVFERHYTVDKSLGKSPDNKFGANPEELAGLISNLENAKLMMGKTRKSSTFSEERARKFARRSIVAAKPIQQGEEFTIENLTFKRPGTGLSPKYFNDVLGKKASKDFKSDDFIEL